ncbi:PA0069 family radical SAM protein [Paracoccus denitrificans]|jgi:DNA repair photolyase|uniref:Radical SAM domain protein n=1 Tax=Paracoccus denitrificans (strain Pd 1222) TaxID=318586 RepID=A1B923_PARDP|nr:PA0069 family radical SAM protein [Paracoccus denitrificans]ABL72017.1 Radical SAM domain protein [Paracoccus denitrificans PD1222]MBB4626076.1 DNA repair photolyase [Paracoccus denitrificans]MCU7426764.1 PA0069 family radical SAM protein [Paracoccus denitrificans]QAR28595.1 PA0069 family radical SAM protein [Paracoccus denitrificans]UPV96740.1 PA0069 family radical SAM protein [Paracoccus denitrificans]
MSLPPRNPDEILRARGADSRPAARFEPYRTEREDDGWDIPEDQALLRTEITQERARSIITRNTSPDIPFDRSLNPYRGCEHGCIYCFARPSHAYLGLSPGLDFETRIVAKPNAPELLAAEIGRRGYAVAPIAFGTNTDPYQPIEAKLGIMRGCLQVLHDWNHPLSLVTRGATVMRDADLLGAMAAKGQAMVCISLTTLDAELARQMEPRAPAPATRLRMIRVLSDVGVPVRVMVAPIIPVLTEHELERIMQAARDAGASAAGMIPIRLPLEVAPLFRDWLERHHPGKAAHVMARIQAMRGGRDNDPRFGKRMRGEGHEADLLHQRFRLARKRLGLVREAEVLDCSRFSPPPRAGDQLTLF